jgi:flagellar protein FliO/FliZ
MPVFLLLALLCTAAPVSRAGEPGPRPAPASAEHPGGGQAALTAPELAGPPASPEGESTRRGGTLEPERGAGAEGNVAPPVVVAPGSGATDRPPAGPSEATASGSPEVRSQVSAPAGGTGDAALTAPGNGESSLWWPVAGPAAVLALLGFAAYRLSRHRQSKSTPLELVGTLSLGPRRQLVVARFGGEDLLIGASEAGLHLLVRRPAVAAHGTDDAWLTNLAAAPDAPSAVEEPWRQPEARLEDQRPAPVAAVAEVASPGAPFETMLDDSVEDQSLRRKLAAGFRGGRS